MGLQINWNRDGAHLVSFNVIVFIFWKAVNLLAELQARN